MTAQHRFLTAVLIFSALVAGSCSSCGEETPDEEIIRTMVKETVAKAEAHDIPGVMGVAAEGFKADPGGYDLRGTKMALFMAFRRYGDFRIHYPNFAVTVSPDRETAQAELMFVVLRKELSVPSLDEAAADPVRWLDEASSNMEPYRLRLDLIRVNEEWKVSRAKLNGARTLGR